MSVRMEKSMSSNILHTFTPIKIALTILGVLVGILPEARAQSCIPNSDHRFGTVGWAPEFKWWRNYNEDYAYSLPTYTTKMYTVGKLNDRERHLNGLMTTEDWCSGGDVDPLDCFNDRVYGSDQRRIYNNIFEYDKQNIRTIISKYGVDGSPYDYNGATTLHFSIGNEPNWFPYVDPVVYADIYKKYYDYIKETLNCQKCVIHNGGIFLGNPLDVSLFLDLVDEAYSAFLWVLGKRNNRIQHYLTWTRRFMQRLTDLGGKVDVFNVHPYNIEIMEGTSNAAQSLDAFLALIRGGRTKLRFQTINNLPSGQYICNDRDDLTNTVGHTMLKLDPDEICAWGVKVLKVSDTEYLTTSFPWYYPMPVVWADEFGLLKNNGSSSHSIGAMNSLVAYFKNKPQVAKWFWYKTQGNDGQIPEVKVSWIKPTHAFNPSFTILAPPNVQLYTDPTNVATRTSIGNNYLCLQSDAPPAEVTRLSWSAYVSPPPAPTYTNIPKWPQSPYNEVLIQPFSSAINPPLGNWYYSQTFSMHVDGVTLSTPCNVVSLYKTFTAAEMDTIHNESDFFVVEAGHGPPLAGDRFTLTIEAPGGSIRTKKVESFGVFGDEANPLAQNDMIGVIEFKKYLLSDEKLKGIKFERGVTLGACVAKSWSFHRLYFARQNPVGIYSAGNFKGIVSPNGIYEGGRTYEIPIERGSCSNCVIDLDPASKAAGFTYSDSDRILRWRPPYSREGVQTVTFLIQKAGTVYQKSHKLRHIRGRGSLPAILSLILN